MADPVAKKQNNSSIFFYKDFNLPDENDSTHIDAFAITGPDRQKMTILPLKDRVSPDTSLAVSGALDLNAEKIRRRIFTIAAHLLSSGVGTPALPLAKKTNGDSLQKTHADYEEILESLYNKAAFLQCIMGDYGASLPYIEEALVIKENFLGKDHLEVARGNDEILPLLIHLKKYDLALQHQQKSLTIKEKLLGKDHLETAKGYADYGCILQFLDRYAEAVKYHQKAIIIMERVLGKEDFNTAQCYGNIGASLNSLGYHWEAVDYLQKGLPIIEKSLEEMDLMRAEWYSTIGMALRSMKEYNKSLPYLQKALRIEEKYYGKEAVATSRGYYNVGMCLSDLHFHDEAAKYMQKAFQISCKVCDSNYEPSLTYLKGLVHSLFFHRNKELCERIGQEILSFCIEKFGEDNLITQYWIDFIEQERS